MARKTSLKNALEQASGKSERVVEMSSKTQSTAQTESPQRAKQPPSRQGKKAITGHFAPAVSRQLKQIALDHDTTVQALLAEALNDLFVKYDKKPLLESDHPRKGKL